MYGVLYIEAVIKKRRKGTIIEFYFDNLKASQVCCSISCNMSLSWLQLLLQLLVVMAIVTTSVCQINSTEWGKEWASSQMQISASIPWSFKYQYVYCIDQTAVYCGRTFFNSLQCKRQSHRFLKGTCCLCEGWQIHVVERVWGKDC